MLDGKLIEHNETSKLFTTPTDPAQRLTSPAASDETRCKGAGVDAS
jgi:hypothetical protein